MARLQILELPEGTSDDRPPFVLVVDQCEGVTLDLVDTIESHWKRIGEQIGARGTLIFTETIDIPANDIPANDTTAHLGGGMKTEIDLKVGDQDVREAIAADMQKMRAAHDEATNVRDKDAELQAANEWIERLGTEAREARAALKRVRALHQPQPDGTGHPDGQQCQTCSQGGGDGYQYLVPWPCPTVRTLDGEQPDTDA